MAALAVHPGDIGLGDVVVGDDGGECEEQQRDGDEQRAEARQYVLERGLHVTRAGRHALHADEARRAIGILDVVLARHQEHEGGGRADEQGVDIDREALHQALLGRVAHFRCRRGVRAGALPRFVRIDAALDAPLDRHADHGAEARIQAEGRAEDQAQHAWQCFDIHRHHQHGHEDVGCRHERHHDFGEMGDALDAAEDDRGEHHGQADTGIERIDTGGGLEAFGDRVGLHARQQQARGQQRGQCKDPGIPLHAKALLDIEGRAAPVLVADLLLVDLAQRRLDEGRAGAEEGHRPHPEHGARAAEGDGGCHTGDVTRANAAGQRHGQGLE